MTVQRPSKGFCRAVVAFAGPPGPSAPPYPDYLASAIAWHMPGGPGNLLGRPATAAVNTGEIRKLHRAGVSKIPNRPPPKGRPLFGSPDFGPTYFSLK